MKKSLLMLVTLIVLVAANIQNLVAQSHTVVAGSTYTYSTTTSIAGSSFTWSINAGSNGVEWSSAVTTTNSKTIQWNLPGTYVVSVRERSSNSCDASNTTTYTVTVIANNTHIQFASISSSDCDGASATDLTLNLTLSGNVVYPVVVNYNVTIGGVTSSRSRTIASGSSIALGSEDNILDNSTTSDVAKTITITSATSHGAAMIIDAQSTYTYTVFGTPSTGAIVVN